MAPRKKNTAKASGSKRKGSGATNTGRAERSGEEQEKPGPIPRGTRTRRQVREEEEEEDEEEEELSSEEESPRPASRRRTEDNLSSDARNRTSKVVAEPRMGRADVLKEGAAVTRITTEGIVMEMAMGNEQEQMEEREFINSRSSSRKATSILETMGGPTTSSPQAAKARSPVRTIRTGAFSSAERGVVHRGTMSRPAPQNSSARRLQTGTNMGTPRLPILQGTDTPSTRDTTFQQEAVDTEDGANSCIVSEVTAHTNTSSRSGFSYPVSRSVRESIKRVVRQKVFPSLKVISGEYDLRRGQFAEQTVWREWVKAQPKDKRPQMTEAVRASFWTEEIKDIVRRDLNSKRNNVSGVVRNKFLGK